MKFPNLSYIFLFFILQTQQVYAFVTDFSTNKDWQQQTSSGDGAVSFGTGNGTTLTLNESSTSFTQGAARVNLTAGKLASDKNLKVILNSDIFKGGCTLGALRYGWSGGMKWTFPGWGTIDAESTSLGYRLNIVGPSGQRVTSFSGICHGDILMELNRNTKIVQLKSVDSVTEVETIIGSLALQVLPEIQGDLSLFSSHRADFPGTGIIEYFSLAILEGFISSANTQPEAGADTNTGVNEIVILDATTSELPTSTPGCYIRT